MQAVDMIIDQYHLATAKAMMNPPRGIRYDQRFDPQSLHAAQGKGGLRCRPAFVEMRSPLHGDDRHARKKSKDEISGMPCDVRDWKARDIAIGNANGLFDSIRQTTEATSQDQPDPGLVRWGMATDNVDGIRNRQRWVSHPKQAFQR